MTEAVRQILNDAKATSNKFESELAHTREILIASASVVEVTEEIDDLKNKAIQVLIESDLPVNNIVTAAELIGIEGPDIIRDFKVMSNTEGS